MTHCVPHEPMTRVDALRKLDLARANMRWWQLYLDELRRTVLHVEQTREAETIYCRCLDELWDAQQIAEKSL